MGGRLAIRRLFVLGLGFGLALAVAGCGEGQARLPASVVTGLRVLGVRAEPPEIRPLEEASLTLLAVDTEGEDLGALWIACDPAFEDDPDAPPFSPCQDAARIAGASGDPEGARVLFASGAARLLGLAGAGARVRYRPPRDEAGDPVDLFASLSPDDPRREAGAAITVLVLVAPMEDLSALVVDPETASLDPARTEIALKRITLSEANAPNTAPTVEGLEVGGVAISPGEEARVEGPVDLLPSLSAPETFTYRHPDGSVSEEREALVVSWFVGAGRVEDARTQAGESDRYAPPAPGQAPPAPEDGRVPLWVVVRDGRGGTGWARFTLRLAP